MLRPALFSPLLALLLSASLAQVDSHGAPFPGTHGRSGNVLSNAPALTPGAPALTPGGTALTPGAPALTPGATALTSPAFRNRAGRPRVAFGDPRRRHHQVAPIPVFYPLYQYPLADAPAPEEQQAADDSATAETDSQALRDAYNRGAQDALAQQQQGRYGQHYLDSRAHSTQQTDTKKTAVAPVESAQDSRPAPEDDSPPTVFIFKDGHKLQTRNFAIMDQTLFDFSSKPLKKIQLSDLDVDATRKANDDLGNPLRL